MTEISFSVAKSQIDINKMKEDFDEADRDESGDIDKREFIKFAKKNGIDKDSADLLFYIYGSEDEDISFEKFCEFLTTLQKCAEEQSEMPLWREFFNYLDKDKNGSISFDEFIEFGKICCPKVSQEDLKAEFDGVDVDKSGLIDFEEMLKIIGK